MESLGSRIGDGERESGSCSSGHVPMTNMDPGIWKKMPNDILDHVFSFLPFWSIARVRSTSKKWKKNLKSATFLTKWRENSPAEVLFLMFLGGWHIQGVAAFNPSLKKWHLIPLYHAGHKEIYNDYHMITSAGGLVCIEEVSWPNRSLVVSNPIDGSFRKLPPMMDMKSPYVVGMMVNPDRSGYKVLVAQDGESLISQHYDSKTDSWKMNDILNSRVAMLAGMTSIGGYLFCLSFWPLGLIAYDIEGATWHDMGVDMPASVSSPHLIQNNGELFLVAGIEEFSQMTSIQIWKVDLQDKKCCKFEQMPNDYFQKFSWKFGVEHFSCMGEAGFICFSDGIAPSFLMFDMNKSSWWWAPPCPFHLSSPKFLSKYAHNPLNPSGFPLRPCFVLSA